MNNIPSHQDLESIMQSDPSKQKQFFKQLHFLNLNRQQLLQLQIEINQLENSEFKHKLNSFLSHRRALFLNELPKESQSLEIERAKVKIQQKKFLFTQNLEQRKFVLEQDKQTFYQNHQNSKQQFIQKVEIIKFKVSFLQKIFMMIGFFLVAFGSFSYLLTEPQFSVPSGGQILKGSTNDALKIVACILIGVIGILIGGLIFYAIKRNSQRFWQQLD